MSEPSPAPLPWRVAALVGRVGTPEILVEDGAAGMRLPSIPAPAGHEPFDTRDLLGLPQLLGVPLVPLRVTWLPTPDWKTGDVVIAAEPLDAAPPGFRWIDPAAAVDDLEPESARDVVRRRTRDVHDASPFEPPWARAGWFARTAEWMVERMHEAGCPATAPPHLVYQGPLAAVLRAPSGDAALFLKCTAPAFPHEASITHALARRTPDLVPQVLASDSAENWVLMRDHGGRLLEGGPDADWTMAMPRIAELHRSWIDATDEVLAAGGQARPIAALADATPGMLDRDDLGTRLENEVRAAWLAAVPRLLDACHALADAGIPDTLLHGDLHPGNVVLRSGGPIVVDWSDGAVSNPLIDLPTFLLRTADVDHRHRLFDAYVDGWDGALPRARFDDMARLAMTVGSLYQVATYQALLPAMEPEDRALFEGADVSWVRRTLECLEHGLEATTSIH